MRRYVVQTTMLEDGADAHTDKPFGERHFWRWRRANSESQLSAIKGYNRNG